MEKIKKIIYFQSYLDMNKYHDEFKKDFYNYSQLIKHFELMWEHREHWTLFFRLGLPMCENNINNYIKQSFGIMKNIIFSKTQAYNSVQVFQFIITNLERFYER